jgi:DNA-directed RNA polymerase subunit M
MQQKGSNVRNDNKKKIIQLSVAKMEFCPECGKILIPKKKGKSKILVCAKCGYESKLSTKTSYDVADEVKHKASDITEVIVVEGEAELSEAELEERRERFIEGIDFFETE